MILGPPDPNELHPNLSRVSARQHRWGSVVVRAAEFWCTGEVLHALPFAKDVRLSAVLEEVGGPCEPRVVRERRCPDEHTPGHMHLAPAEMNMWGYTRDARYVRDVTLVFDEKTVEQRLGETLRSNAFSTPRSRFSDRALGSLVGLLAESVDDPDPSKELFGEGLVTAIVARLFAREPSSPKRTTKLAPWQLRRVTDYVDAHVAEPISLERLASLVGISQRHFSRAFKATTGNAPHQWQLERRVAHAQTLLVSSSISLEEVAGATGFWMRRISGGRFDASSGRRRVRGDASVVADREASGLVREGDVRFVPARAGTYRAERHGIPYESLRPKETSPCLQRPVFLPCCAPRTASSSSSTTNRFSSRTSIATSPRWS